MVPFKRHENSWHLRHGFCGAPVESCGEGFRSVEAGGEARPFAGLLSKLSDPDGCCGTGAFSVCGFCGRFSSGSKTAYSTTAQTTSANNTLTIRMT